MKTQRGCQLTGVEDLSVGLDNPFWFFSFKRLYRSFTARLSPRFKKSAKKILGNPFGWIRTMFPKNQGKNACETEKKIPNFHTEFQCGEIVRVKSDADIEATLDKYGQFKGCSFLEEMKQYCGTEQRVYRTVKRFVDERDRLVKQSKGIVLLEGVHCHGTQEFGDCDRSCFYFWREEWLEKI